MHKGGRTVKKRRIVKSIRLTVLALCGVVSLTPPVQRLAELPLHLSIPLGQCIKLPLNLPFHSYVASSDKRIAETQMTTDCHHQDIAVISHDIGETIISTRLFGLLPWKTIQVDVVPEQQVYVGGQTVGVRLLSKGVIVVGYQRQTNSTSPAANAHIQIGDVIEKINTQTIQSTDDVKHAMFAENRHQPLLLMVRRGITHVQVPVRPFQDASGHSHLGLYVRDRTAGVGTLTFYDPVRHRFGALGHVITDVDTGQAVEGTGSLHDSEIVGMVKGIVGRPGEKKGRFINTPMQLGHIEKNTPFGVFGSMNQQPPHGLLGQLVPVALPSQVHGGPAQMFTVVHGQRIEAFTVDIENIVKQDEPSTKSMIVHVTDARLLNETGGIVQGMSGSPLVQDGRLIGAVTHVFVSDPTRGYGVYAEWMLQEAEAGGAQQTWTEPGRAASKHILFWQTR